MFLFMCRYSLCSIVYRFPLNNKRKKKVCFLLFIYNVQVSINNDEKKNMKKGQTSKDVYNKDADQTVPQHNLMPVVIQPGMFYSF